MQKKTCSRCKLEKSSDDFSKDSRGRYGLQARCKRCAVEVNTAYRASNPDKAKAHRAADYSAHKEAYKARAKARYEKKRDEIKRNTAAYQRENKAKKSDWERTYRSANLPAGCVRTAERKARKLLATPAWADLEDVKAFYELSRRLTTDTGIPHHVDHIVPLKSKLVCGLHCEANLQVIPGAENMSKCNRSWPDMP